MCYLLLVTQYGIVEKRILGGYLKMALIKLSDGLIFKRLVIN